VGNRDLKTTTATIVGSMDWPWLVLDQIQADFEDGSIVKAKGKFEVQKQTIAGAHLDFTGPLIRRWLPTAWSYGGLSLSGDAEGPLKSIVHRGHLEISNVTNAQFYPLQIKADWNGNQLNLGQAAVSVAASNSALSARFSGSLATAKAPQTTNLITLQLQNLLLAKRGAANLELEKPIQMSVAWSATNRWSIHSDELHLLGRDGDVQLQAAMDWPNSGAFQGSIRNLSSDLLADFINASVERFEVGKLEAAAGWTNGPAKFQIDLSARSFQLPGLTETDFTGPFKMEPVSIELKLTGDQNGLAISNLIANSGTSTVARAQGFLPLTVNPVEPTNFIHLDSTKPLQLSATSQPHAFFWDQLAEWTGVFLQDPNLSLGLSGTWTSPRGQIQLRAQRLKFREAPPATPSFENLEVSLQLDQDRAWLTNCQVLIQGQAVTLSGQLPLGESFWDDVKQKKSPNLDKASGHLQFTNAQLAAFVPLFPTLLSPQGELSLNVRLQPGGKLEGDLLVHQARTRPLSTLGPIREIEVKMKLLDRELRLDSAKATIGGAPVAATGQADLSGTDWLRGAVPPFQFTLRGTNVPLSRQPESIVRADLDLAISKTNQAAAVITGTARLRDSFYLSDVADLVPGRVSSPSRRPPYFSIEAMPLADWRLAVHVTGSRFMKVRSTLFNGQVSANLTLQGTLKDPMAIGDLKIDSGLVRFPFANLEVQQGFVNLTSADPYRPQLIVNAVSKRFGYEAKMEVSGPVDAPVIQFSSTPPLDSEQIVLMLTAGELPKSGLNLTPQQKAETVALFLGSDLLTKLGFGDHTEDRLTIRSGEQVSEQGTPTYNVEYKLSKRWALVGEYDRFNDFNAGLKWRIYSK
jgi:translocation and assembly module TamB